MKTVLMVLAAGSAAAVASASTILSPTAVLLNTGGQFDADYPITRTIDRSGLFTPFVSGVSDFDAYLAGSPLHNFIAFGNEWFTPVGVTASTIVYDLGAEYTVDRLALWNEDASGFTSLVVTTSLVSDFSSSASGGAFNPANNDQAIDYAAEVLAFTGGARGARYIKIDVTGPQPNGSFTGLGMGEIAFSVNPIPAPGAIALIVPALAAVSRRRR
jgi:hypothetical protein